MGTIFGGAGMGGAKGWLNSVDGTDYVAADDCFGRIAGLQVEFYDSGTRDAATDTEWLTAYWAGLTSSEFP